MSKKEWLVGLFGLAVGLSLVLIGLKYWQTPPVWKGIEFVKVGVSPSRVIGCVVFRGYNKGGITCDWENNLLNDGNSRDVFDCQ